MNNISEIFSTDEIIPSAGQGVIALQCKNDDRYIKNILKKLMMKKLLKVFKQKEMFLKF